MPPAAPVHDEERWDKLIKLNEINGVMPCTTNRPRSIDRDRGGRVPCGAGEWDGMDGMGERAAAAMMHHRHRLHALVCQIRSRRPRTVRRTHDLDGDDAVDNALPSPARSNQGAQHRSGR